MWRKHERLAIPIFVAVLLLLKSPALKASAYAYALDTATHVIQNLRLCEQLNDTASKRSEAIARGLMYLTRRSSQPDWFTASMLALARALWARGRYQESTIFVDSLAIMTARIKNKVLLADIRFVMGRCEHYRGNYALALENYFLALSYAERISDTVRVGEVCNTIGGIYYNQGDGKTAYNYYRRCLNIQLHRHNDFRSGRGYLNTGSALILQDKLEESRRHLDSSLYYYQKINSLEGISYVYGTLPSIFLKSNKPDSALKYLLLARDATLKVNKLYALGQVNKDIAKIYLDKNKYSKSLEYINEGLAFCQKTRQNYEQLLLYQLKAQVFEKMDQPQKALENYKLYKAYSDSVINAASVKKQTEEALAYEYNKRQYEQKLANEKENLLREEKESRQRIILYSILIGVAISAALLYYRYRTKKKAGDKLESAYKILEQKNLLIEENAKALSKSLDERELLLKEIHHRVKNNLKVISGLLELQKEELTEEGSRAAFDEGQSRVRSISLIHQSLYQNDNLSSVQFLPFIKNLVNQVKEVFENSDFKMNVKLEVPEIDFDIDTAVPLSLILNELLTNSYKYASVKGTTGQVEIALWVKGQGNYALVYKDNGPGMKAGIDFGNATSLGLRLIKGLAAQLMGEANYEFDHGAMFVIAFKDSAARRMEA